ncbi:MAG: hypothetical protein KIT36_18715 [Alphaproteobacteria bacterium]|nr:hypothetical protein [Alphaproteobacteria bacterium]
MAEIDCGQQHLTIEDAIHHARTNLGGNDVEPFWGGMAAINPGRVVGYQVTSRRRWRLDFDPGKGVHVNEENFDAPPSRQKVVHAVTPAAFDASGRPIASDMQVRLYWNKWTTRYGTPGRGIFCTQCDNWHINGRCPF